MSKSSRYMFLRYIFKLAEKSPRIKKVVNFFGLSLGSLAVLLSTGGVCPFCGAPVVACPAGIASTFATGFLASSVIYALMGLWNGIKKFKRVIIS